MEKERAAQEKEMEVARLRGLQERVADRQSEVDEMRARRWQVGAASGTCGGRTGAACVKGEPCCARGGWVRHADMARALVPNSYSQEAKDREWRNKERAAAERQVGGASSMRRQIKRPAAMNCFVPLVRCDQCGGSGRARLL